MTTPAATYDIERRLGSTGTPSIIATGQAGLTVDIVSLTPSTQYGFRVRRTGETAWSNLVLATTAAAPVVTPTDPTLPPALTGPAGTVAVRSTGAMTGTTATLALRTTGCTQVRAYVTTGSTTVTTGRIYSSTATPDVNGMSKVTFTGLAADTQYFGRIEPGPTIDQAAPFQFRTFPSGATSFRFAFGSCWRHTLASSAAFQAIEAKNPRFFLHTGDLHYYDIGVNDQALFRTAWATSLGDPGLKSLLSKIPWDYVWSDHDYGPNNAFGTSASKPAAQATYRQHMPHYALPSADGGIYHTFVFGRIRFIVMDLRSYKTNHLNTDNSTKTMLGTTQKQWLKDLVSSATEPVIVLVSDLPWNYATTAGEDSWAGYGTERTELINHINSTGKAGRVIVITGDQHALAADNGTNSPGGYPVFAAAPFDQGTSIKGGPWSNGIYVGGSTGTRIQAYGQCDVTDTGGSTITLTYNGYTADGVSRVNLTKTITVGTTSGGGTTPPPPPPPTTSTEFLIGLSGAQIRSRPSSGSAFSNVKAQADASFSPDLNTNSSTNGARAFAAGLMYQFYKTSNPTLATTYRNKVIAGWDTILGMSTIHIQGIIRQLPGWVLAADLAEHRTTAVLNWCSAVRTKTGSSSGPSVTGEGRWTYGLYQMASDTVNNHGTLAVGSLLALSRFVGDTTMVNHCIKLWKGFIGVMPPEGWPRHPAGTNMSPTPTGFTFTAGEPYSRTWTNNNGAANWYPMGPSSTLYPGIPLQKDGVCCDDISRDGKSYSLDSSGKPIPGSSGIQYTTTAMAGVCLSAVLLEPLIGASVWTMQDEAMRRWRDWLQRYGPWSTGYYVHPGVGGWMDMLLNKKYGTSFATPTTGGYSISFFDWLL